MTGTIHQIALQAKNDEMLRQAAEARKARVPAQPKDSHSRSVRVLILNGQSPGGAGVEGGGIRNGSTLTITDCVIRDSVTGRGANGAAGCSGGPAAGVAALAGVTIRNSTISDNAAGAGGAGGNATGGPDARAGDGQTGGLVGGVLASGGTVTIENTTKHKALKPGSYKLVLVAKDVAGNASKPKTVSFKVVK